MVVFLNILIILAILSVVIFVHELGHLIACKIKGVFVEEFALGLGPKVYSKKYGETIYSIRAFPIGGFNKIKGEEFEGDEVETDPRSFANQGAGTRLFIILSGVFLNVILAIVLFYIILASMSYNFALSSDFKDFEPVVGSLEMEVVEEVKYEGLVEGEGALDAGLPERGEIKSVNGQEIVLSSELTDFVGERAGEEVSLEVCQEDDCEVYIVSVNEEGQIGVYLFKNYYPYISYTGWERAFVGFGHILNWGKIFGIAFDDMFTEAEETGDYEQVALSVSGPVGLYVVVDIIRDMGWRPLVGIMADISLTVGLINLLPIPALDGGRAVMILGEILFRKPLNKKIETWAIQISFILLLLLIVAILFKDIIYFDRLRELFD